MIGTRKKKKKTALANENNKGNCSHWNEKKTMPHDSPCQLKRPDGLEQKTLNYKKHGSKKKIAWTK